MKIDTLAQTYDPYGSLMASTGTAPTPFGFDSEQTDGNGLIYLRARYYAPEMGRFMTRDTWSGDANQPISYNKWGYANASPLDFIDATGHIPEHCLHSPPDSWPSTPGCLGYTRAPVIHCPHTYESMPLGNYNLSAYFIPHESQYVKADSNPIASLGGMTANKYFLFSEQGICYEGVGKLAGNRGRAIYDGQYVSCTKTQLDWPKEPNDGDYNMPPLGEIKSYEKDAYMFQVEYNGLEQGKYVAFDTVAVR